MPDLFLDTDCFWVGFQLAMCIWLFLLQVRFAMRALVWMFSDKPRKAVRSVD